MTDQASNFTSQPSRIEESQDTHPVQAQAICQWIKKGLCAKALQSKKSDEIETVVVNHVAKYHLRVPEADGKWICNWNGCGESFRTKPATIYHLRFEHSPFNSTDHLMSDLSFPAPSTTPSSDPRPGRPQELTAPSDQSMDFSLSAPSPENTQLEGTSLSSFSLQSDDYPSTSETAFSASSHNFASLQTPSSAAMSPPPPLASLEQPDFEPFSPPVLRRSSRPVKRDASSGPSAKPARKKRKLKAKTSTEYVPMPPQFSSLPTASHSPVCPHSVPRGYHTRT
ncbi:hypothetical protein JCM5350_008021 [Sporobolomyces pararoseus]